MVNLYIKQTIFYIFFGFYFGLLPAFISCSLIFISMNFDMVQDTKFIHIVLIGRIVVSFVAAVGATQVERYGPYPDRIPGAEIRTAISLK